MNTHPLPPNVVLRRCFLGRLARGTLAISLACGSFLTAADASQVEHLEMAVKAREHHADVLLKALRATDKRVESRLQNLVNALKVVADSKDSRTKVARLKEETIEGLKKSIELYNRERAEIQEQIMRPTANLTEEQKKQIRKALDSRIEKRVAQIVELQQSLPAHEDYEKYKVVAGGVGFADTTILKNEDWEQNRRVTLHTDAVRKELVDELQRSIERLADQDRKLRLQLQQSPGAGKLLQEEIERNAGLMAARQGQLDQVLSEPPLSGRPVGKGEANALDKAVGVAVTGIRVELTQLFKEYSDFITFLPQLNAARAQLAQAKALPNKPGSTP